MTAVVLPTLIALPTLPPELMLPVEIAAIRRRGRHATVTEAGVAVPCIPPPVKARLLPPRWHQRWLCRRWR